MSTGARQLWCEGCHCQWRPGDLWSNRSSRCAREIRGVRRWLRAGHADDIVSTGERALQSSPHTVNTGGRLVGSSAQLYRDRSGAGAPVRQIHGRSAAYALESAIPARWAGAHQVSSGGHSRTGTVSSVADGGGEAVGRRPGRSGARTGGEAARRQSAMQSRVGSASRGRGRERPGACARNRRSGRAGHVW